MKILVTGGAGFIGSNLVRYLLREAEAELGCRVTKLVNLDLLTYAGNLESLADVMDDPRHVFVRGDVGDVELVRRLMREHGIEHVMHLAAESHVDRSIEGPENFVATNVVGTLRLLEAFRRWRAEMGGENCGRFLQVSTDEVFGALGPDDAAFDEASSYAPNSPYSASKAGGDHLARAYFHTYGVPVLITHCCNNYGPYQFPEKLVPLMIGKLMSGGRLPVYGDGRQVRDWLHVRDHCRGLVMALLNGKAGESYVFGGRCELRNIDLVRRLIATLRELAPELEIGADEEVIEFVRDRPGHDLRYAIDPAKAERELGWTPHVDFADGLRETVRWYLENRDWLKRVAGLDADGMPDGFRLGEIADEIG